MSSVSSKEMSWNEGEELASYQQISRTALVALAFSLLSFLAFGSSLLWIFPFIGLALAALALFQISRNDSLSGKGIATFALVLCSFNAVAAPAQRLSRQQRLTSIARQHFQTWMNLVEEGNYRQAYELTLNYAERQPENADLDVIYGNTELNLDGVYSPSMQELYRQNMISGREELERFFRTGGPQTLLEATEPIKFVRVAAIIPRIETEQVVLQYQAKIESGETRDVLVTMERRRRKDLGETHWRVESIRDPERFDMPAGPVVTEGDTNAPIVGEPKDRDEDR